MFPGKDDLLLFLAREKAAVLGEAGLSKREGRPWREKKRKENAFYKSTETHTILILNQVSEVSLCHSGRKENYFQ
jgi:hypothetical protein